MTGDSHGKTLAVHEAGVLDTGTEVSDDTDFGSVPMMLSLPGAEFAIKNPVQEFPTAWTAFVPQYDQVQAAVNALIALRPGAPRYSSPTVIGPPGHAGLSPASARASP